VAQVNEGLATAAAVAFSGQLISVTPGQTSYNAGEEVILRIKSHVDADGLHWYSFWWYTLFEIYDADTGELLVDNWNIHGHGTAPSNPHDEVDEDFYQSIGKMPNRDFKVQIQLFGDEGEVSLPGIPPTFPILCDIKSISIPLTGGPPPPTGSPWKWVAIGSGVFVLIGVLLKRRE